jgi:DNA-binding transcriptional ArsR family regulator
MLRQADGIYGLQAYILKTIASPRRLELIHYLAESGPVEVRCLAEQFGMTQPAASQHLSALRTAGLVEPIRDGREVRYRLVDPEIAAACDLMRQVLVRRIAHMGDMAASFSTVGPDATELTEAIAAGPSSRNSEEVTHG